MFPVLEPLEVAICLLLGHAAALDRFREFSCGVPNPNVQHGAVELSRLGGRADLRCLSLRYSSSPDHPLDSPDQPLNRARPARAVSAFRLPALYPPADHGLRCPRRGFGYQLR